MSRFLKGDRKIFKNCRVISLLNVEYKLYTRIINIRLSRKFLMGKNTLDSEKEERPQQMTGKRMEFHLQTITAIKDLKKAFGNVDRYKVQTKMENLLKL